MLQRPSDEPVTPVYGCVGREAAPGKHQQHLVYVLTASDNAQVTGQCVYRLAPDNGTTIPLGTTIPGLTDIDIPVTDTLGSKKTTTLASGVIS